MVSNDDSETITRLLLPDGPVFGNKFGIDLISISISLLTKHPTLRSLTVHKELPPPAAGSVNGSEDSRLPRGRGQQIDFGIQRQRCSTFMEFVNVLRYRNRNLEKSCVLGMPSKRPRRSSLTLHPKGKESLLPLRPLMLNPLRSHNVL